MIKRTALAVALTFAPAAVFAQSYIVPDGDCGAITFHVSRGTDFPNLGATVPAGDVKAAWLFPQMGKRIAAEPVSRAHSADYNATLGTGETVLMAGIDFAPTVVGDETRTDHAKAFVFCGPATPAYDWQRSIELGLEIYPEGWNGPRPRMKAGDTMWFITVDKASKQIVRDVTTELYRAGAGRIATGKPNKIGGMTFKYPEPGRYMVVSTYRRADPEHRSSGSSTPAR